MKKDKGRYFSIAMGLLLLVGCSSEQQITPSEPVCLRSTDKSRIMEITEDVLTRMNFVIEKYDVEAGFVRTKPLRAGQVFEFWRSDNAAPDAWAEANLHSIRRTAQLNISEESGVVCTTCQVEIERLSLPEREITGMSWLAGMFTDSDQTQQRLTLNPEQQEGMAWLDLGPDPALERKILVLIEKKFTELEGPR
ncbi:MAG: hypothetical protein DRP65_07175 [Planctomycetota bacterium]|nr:MAG: hypothetical protein DRP65_07175 [Planctomycetota bacterium]